MDEIRGAAAAIRAGALGLLAAAVAGCALVAGGAPCEGARTGTGVAAATDCRYDPQSGTVRACVHPTADGSCAHFGAACDAPAAPAGAPAASACRYDAGSGALRECVHVKADGTCAHFAGPCTSAPPAAPTSTP